MRKQTFVKESEYDKSEPLSQQKSLILQTFDFQNVARIMDYDILVDPATGKYHPWYLFSRTGLKSATSYELKDMAEKLLDFVIKDPASTSMARSGPFRAMKMYGKLYLDFGVSTSFYD